MKGLWRQRIHLRFCTASGMLPSALVAAGLLSAGAQRAAADDAWGIAATSIIATGIPGAGAVTEVGDFLLGSPLHDKAPFALFTQRGSVLSPNRVLVASTSNFGAPLARPNDPEGSILSIDPAAGPIVVPRAFAAAGGQATALAGAVQVYAAQNSAFLNSVRNPTAVTSELPAVSLPLGISINNGNGRPWVANAPNGAIGMGTVTVLDPQGYPLAGPPNPLAGGVFTGNETNRNTAAPHGLTSAAVGLAIITKAPDLTGMAVYAAVEADGSVVQVNVFRGVDDLAPAGTVTPLRLVNRATAETTQPGVVVRKGVAASWVPTRNLFIADPQANSLVVLDLQDNGVLFTASRREIQLAEFNAPVDVAPTTREVSSGSFASNTTLGGGSDLYVLNRGNNTILRISTNGRFRSGRFLAVTVAGFRANGLAVSSDGQTIYVTGTTPGGSGALISTPAFGGAKTTANLFAQAQRLGLDGSVSDFGSFIFSVAVSPHEGLGPLYNAQSCADCHSSPFVGGMGLLPGQSKRLVGRIRADGSFSDLAGHGGPTARLHSVTELGVACNLPTGIPPEATLVSRRNAMTLRGDGIIDTIAIGDVLANRALEPAAVRGRPNVLADGRTGKFGWKASDATLVEFVGDAFRDELGVTNPLQPLDEISGCNANQPTPEADALVLQAASKFLNAINPGPTSAACAVLPGAAIFQSTGCSSCHTPSLPGPGTRQPVYLYSDLLLHAMGPSLDDHMTQGSAAGNEWRTMPLWGVSERGKFLHDGRASTLLAAILAHDGQARAARDAVAALNGPSQEALTTFLNCL